MSLHPLDRALEHLARRQFGVFTYQQARQLGYADKMIVARVRSGAWIRLESGVYALASAKPTWQRQYKAAELSVPGAAVAGLAAAKVQSLDGFNVARPELVVAYTRSVRNRLATVHRSDTAATTLHDGFRVTTVAQTLLDVLMRVPLSKTERAMDRAILEHRLDVAALDERADAYAKSRRPGIATGRALDDERTADGWTPPESELERRLVRLVERIPGVAPITLQATLPWWTTGEGRVDILIALWRLIIEADGRRWHARVADFDADRWRDDVAVANGHRVMRFTHTHLRHRPVEVAGLILQAGRAAMAA